MGYAVIGAEKLSSDKLSQGSSNPVIQMGDAGTSAPVLTESSAAPLATGSVVVTDTTPLPAVKNTSDTLADATALSVNTLLDLNAQSLATLTANPAYAIAVAGFQMSMANSRLDLALAAARPSLPDRVGPVTAISAINPIQHTMGDL